MGVWEVAFNFWFLKIFKWFLGGAKVWVKKSFLIENLKMDTGQFFWLICGYCCEAMCKSSIWSNLFHLGTRVLNEFPSCEYWVKKVRILIKKATQIRASQIRASQIRTSQIRATQMSSNHRELHGAIFFHSRGVKDGTHHAVKYARVHCCVFHLLRPWRTVIDGVHQWSNTRIEGRRYVNYWRFGSTRRERVVRRNHGRLT